MQAKLAQLGPKDLCKPGEGPLSLPVGVPMAAVPAMPQHRKQELFKVRSFVLHIVIPIEF